MSDRSDPELAAEQLYLDAVYERLDAMRLAAESVAAAYGDVRAGGTHQARLERDIAVETTHRRLAALDIGDTPLCFGRIDRVDDTRFYVGRLAVDDEDRTPLVIDWRAPVAEPFYRATALDPMGVLRRRHLLTRHGREVVGLDDEVFDADAVEAAGLKVLGEGALLSALERNRTGRMADIVATIQSEQDAAVRADLAGALVVAGGPGTGKTAVALHRAAYLLYTFRRRLGSQGVLLVGPSPVFLRYIEQVLPSLGEHEVQLATISGLKPGLRAIRPESPAVAAVKGRVEMATVLRRALADRERPPRADVDIRIDGLRLRLTRRECRRVLERTRRRRETHNALRPLVERSLLDRLVAQYRAALARTHREVLDLEYLDDEAGYDAQVAASLARGEPPPREWERELNGRLRRHPEVRKLLERMWPVLTGPELVHDLCSFSGLIRSAADGVLSREDQQLLFRPRSESVAAVPWTDADVALVDEADALLGPVEAARPQRRNRRSDEERQAVEAAQSVVRELGLGGYTTASALAERYGDGSGPGDDAVPELRTFGHVLVDEAQDLTPMQWRMLGRRCPSGSMTIVGDFGQASRPGAAGGWDEVLGLLPSHDPPRRVTLTVNYRTPAEIMDLANRLLAVAASGVEPTQSVRRTGIAPQFTRVDDLVAGSATAARSALARGGTVAVIAPEELHAPLVDALADVGVVADAAEALDAPVGVLVATDAKGLEFDHVVVVEPARLVTPDSAGLRLLYVTLTRATQTLTVVHAEGLPEALAS
ncbi:MAG TPA: ATP-binding domain-containing protein [Acidimicrobiia bacterium]